MWTNVLEMISWLWELIDELKDIGEEEWAKRLDNALRIGGTSSELLGEIRLFLVDFAKSDLPKKLGIKKEIRQAIKAINKAFRRNFF